MASDLWYLLVGDDCAIGPLKSVVLNDFRTILVDSEVADNPIDSTSVMMLIGLRPEYGYTLVLLGNVLGSISRGCYDVHRRIDCFASIALIIVPTMAVLRYGRVEGLTTGIITRPPPTFSGHSPAVASMWFPF